MFKYTMYYALKRYTLNSIFKIRVKDLKYPIISMKIFNEKCLTNA